MDEVVLNEVVQRIGKVQRELDELDAWVREASVNPDRVWEKFNNEVISCPVTQRRNLCNKIMN